MSTKRVPLQREILRRITPKAVELFSAMQAENLSADGWWRLHALLHAELGCKPWQWPAIEDPAAECPYPRSHANFQWWHDDRASRPEAFELFEALKALSAA